MSLPIGLYAFDWTAPLARETARLLGGEVEPIRVHHFPDDESIVRIPRTSYDAAYVFCSLDHPNEKLIELLLAADALRRQSIDRVVLVAPYLAYMRQDRVFCPGEPVSQRVVAGLLDTAFDGVLTVEPHLHRIHRLAEIFEHARARSTSAAAPISGWLSSGASGSLLVGPDEESAPWIQEIAEGSGLPSVVAAKVRHGDENVTIELPSLPAANRSAWIVDDIASSGATLLAVAKALRERGVERVSTIVTHAIFGRDSLERLSEAKFEEIVSTNTVPHPTNRITVAPILAEMIRAFESEGAFL